MAGPAFNTWSFPDGTLWAAFFRTAGGCLLRFPELADFELSADGTAATAHPCPGVDAATLEHLHLNQVRPLMLSRQGRLVFHASAVAVPGGAVVFAAASGRGKSTLAASFAASGHAFLTDDGLVLHSGSTGLEVLPSHPSLRLRADSSAALIAPGAAIAAAVCYSSKSRLLAGDQLRFCTHPQPLRCVYFLGDGQASAIGIAPLPPAQALIEWVRHSFLLDIDRQEQLASHFDALARLSEHPVHYRLDYPRHYSALPQVRAAILQHLQSISSPAPRA